MCRGREGKHGLTENGPLHEEAQDLAVGGKCPVTSSPHECGVMVMKKK